MKHLMLVLVFVSLSRVLGAALPQNSPGSEDDKSRVVITELFPPVYSPLARQMHIAGNVHLGAKVRKDGSLDSVEVITGHPLLQQAAIDSAKKTKFDCVNCTDAGASLELTYTFALEGEEDCCRPSDVPASGPTPRTLPHVERLGNHITVVDQPVCICDPALTIRKARSIKCLYLWHCGRR
jgi:TonB family protein